MIFVTKVYPKLMFYIPSREAPFQFDRGVFNTEDAENKEQQAELDKVLSKLANNPGMTGVQAIEDTRSPFQCDECGKGFASQAALFGHKPVHKTAAQIEKEALQEGQTVPSNVST